MTNRQYTSWDVALRFGKQFKCRQIFDGLSFTYIKKWKQNRATHRKLVRGEVGLAIKGLQADNNLFKYHFFGARESVSDSYYILNSKIISDLSDLFKTNEGLLLGQVKLDGDGELTFQKYAFVGGDSEVQSWCPLVRSDRRGNLLIRPNRTVPVGEEFECKEAMDFDFVANEREGVGLINISKFGTFWCLINEFLNLHA